MTFVPSTLPKLFRDEYKILCLRHTWDSSVDLIDVNLFSSVPPIAVDNVNLIDYLIDMSTLNLSFDGSAKDSAGKDALWFEWSDINFTFSGIRNNKYLKTFFGLFTDTTYIKYEFQIVRLSDNKIIYRGTASQEDIEETFEDSEEQQQIKVQVFGFEKEFKEYYSKQPILAPYDDWEGTWDEYLGKTGVRWQDMDSMLVRRNPRGFDNWGRQWIPLWSVLYQQFSSSLVQWYLEDNSWYVLNIPILCKQAGSQRPFFVKSGYTRIWSNGENKYDYLRRICNSMGWIFFYYDGVFHIQRRMTQITTITNLDFAKVNNLLVKKQKTQSQFDTLLLLDGDIFGGNASGGGGTNRGVRFQAWADQNITSEGNWWDVIGDGQPSSNTWYLYTNPNRPYMNYDGEDDRIFKYFYHLHNSYSRSSLDKANMLTIDAGDTGIYYFGYDTSDGQTFAWNEGLPEIDDDEIRFKGCYGNHLFQFGSGALWDYQHYTKTDTFYNNFLKFFNSTLSDYIEIEYSEIIIDPLQKFHIINSRGMLNDNDIWIIIGMDIDFKNKVTKLKLQKENN